MAGQILHLSVCLESAVPSLEDALLLAVYIYVYRGPSLSLKPLIKLLKVLSLLRERERESLPQAIALVALYRR